MTAIIQYILHLDIHLAHLVTNIGGFWTIIILFSVIFAETGLVVTPFLPGDSLLFASGILAAHDVLPINLLVLFLIIAAITGNVCNYWVGRKLGHLLFTTEDALFFKQSRLQKTHAFYEKYGGKTLIIARFIPIVRTYAPFVAGVSRMTLRRFYAYNAISGALWVSVLLYTSFFFGNIPWVKNNFSAVIMLIIAASILWPAIEIAKKSLIKRRS